MFEDSFVSARVEGSAAGRRRWVLAGSVVVQVMVAALVVALPMLRPERLVARAAAPRVFVPLRPMPRPKVVETRRAVVATAAPAPAAPFTAPARIPRGIEFQDPGAAPVTTAMLTGGGMSGTGMPAALAEATGTGTRVGVEAAAGPKEAVRVSAGVTAGLLVEPIRPVYPAIAKSAHVSGEVVVAATISPEGRIEAARVVRGPAMLAEAAMEAIRRARYRPYLLNGEPTAVETVITVEFRLGG